MPVLEKPQYEIFAQAVAIGTPIGVAYIQAGYKPSLKNAQRLRNTEGVSSRIEEILSQSAQKCGVTVEKIVEELAKIGFSNILDYVQSGNGNIEFTDLQSLTREQGAAISEITVDTLKSVSSGKNKSVTVRTKFKLHDKQAALVNLGKHLGMFTDKIELNVSGIAERLARARSRKTSE